MKLFAWIILILFISAVTVILFIGCLGVYAINQIGWTENSANEDY